MLVIKLTFFYLYDKTKKNEGALLFSLYERRVVEMVVDSLDVKG